MTEIHAKKAASVGESDEGQTKREGSDNEDTVAKKVKGKSEDKKKADKKRALKRL